MYWVQNHQCFAFVCCSLDPVWKLLCLLCPFILHSSFGTYVHTYNAPIAPCGSIKCFWSWSDNTQHVSITSTTLPTPPRFLFQSPVPFFPLSWTRHWNTYYWLYLFDICHLSTSFHINWNGIKVYHLLNLAVQTRRWAMEWLTIRSHESLTEDVHESPLRDQAELCVCSFMKAIRTSCATSCQSGRSNCISF